MFFVYVLVDPLTQHIRYVGYTGKSLSQRLSSHMRDITKNHRTNWISKLKASGKRPEIVEVESFSAKEDALAAEIAWISYFRYIGCDLVNGTDGGVGYPISKENRVRISASKKGKKLTEEHRRKIGDGSRGRSHSPETRAKISATRMKNMTDEVRMKISQGMMGNKNKLGKLKF
jgi:predicted GIY-YIG superfamily endonuclease